LEYRSIAHFVDLDEAKQKVNEDFLVKLLIRSRKIFKCQKMAQIKNQPLPLMVCIFDRYQSEG